MKAVIAIGLLIVLLCCLSCASNPSGNNPISTPPRTISGTVTLSSNDNPEEVFIWFEGFNFATRPNAQGRFEFTLPPPTTQTPSGGATGVFNIFFYIANFNLVAEPIVLVNGLLGNPLNEINENGEIVQEILLSEQLKIFTEVQPPKVEKSPGTISLFADVILQTFKDTVQVFFPTRVGNLSGPVFLQNIETGAVSIIESFIVDTAETDSVKVSTTAEIRELVMNLNLADLPVGKYEVIPYIIVINELVPAGLIDRIGQNVQSFSPDYLKIPFKRRGGELEIVARPGG